MKPLNRPMFRMGGPIKEGIMDGIEEPRIGFQDGTQPSLFGFRFDEPFLTGQSFRNLFKTPAQIKQQDLSNLFTPDFSMSDYGKVPRLVNQEDTLLASAAPDNIKVPSKKMEMVDPNIITTADITEEVTPDSINIKDETKTEIVPKQAGLEIPDRNRGKILTDPDKKPKDPKADSELLQKLGYDRAVKRGNYQLIEAIRRGLTEGGVQGALDAAFAAGAQDPYAEASKIRQAAALKEYEMDLEEKKYQRRRGDKLEDQIKLLKEKEKISPKEFSKSVRTKDYEFAINTLGMTKEEAIDYANKSSTVAENIFKVTSKSQGGFAAPNQLADAIRASGEKVDAVFDKSDQATIAAYEAKDGQYVIFDQKIFVGYKDPNSDEVLLKPVR
jgi:hypothetical protein